MVFTCDWSSSLRAVAKSCTASYISAVSVCGGARDNNIEKDFRKIQRKGCNIPERYSRDNQRKGRSP